RLVRRLAGRPYAQVILPDGIGTLARRAFQALGPWLVGPLRQLSAAGVAGGFLRLHVSGARADALFELRHPQPVRSVFDALRPPPPPPPAGPPPRPQGPPRPAPRPPPRPRRRAPAGGSPPARGRHRRGTRPSMVDVGLQEPRQPVEVGLAVDVADDGDEGLGV